MKDLVDYSRNTKKEVKREVRVEKIVKKKYQTVVTKFKVAAVRSLELHLSLPRAIFCHKDLELNYLNKKSPEILLLGICTLSSLASPTPLSTIRLVSNTYWVNLAIG